MICSFSELKTLLNISTTKSDNYISFLMPIVQSDLLNYLNNSFNPEYTIYTTSENLGIGTTGIDVFSFEYDIYKLDKIYIGGSSQNWTEGTTADYYINGDDYSITIRKSITSTETITADYYRPVYPQGLMVVYADMIDYRLNTDNRSPFKSETIGHYTYTKDEIVNGYPKSIINPAKKWRKVGW